MDRNQLDLIREFNFLVEMHFRKNHSVAEYAAMLHKSPKTLSNLFAQYNTKTPVQIIHNRIQMEARRMLQHTHQSIKEIGYSLGFDNIQSFSRFFKKIPRNPLSNSEKSTKSYRWGKIDNSSGIMA